MVLAGFPYERRHVRARFPELLGNLPSSGAVLGLAPTTFKLKVKLLAEFDGNDRLLKVIDVESHAEPRIPDLDSDDHALLHEMKARGINVAVASDNTRDPFYAYGDLDKFGFFQDEWLRGGPVRRWVPKAFADQPIYTFETGGSTGVPKSRINVNDFRIDYENFSDTLPDESFPKGSDWLMVGPSGPRRLRLAIEHLAQHRGGICFMVDLDPRWVIKLIKARQMEQMEAYKRHVIDQALTLLKAHDIECIFTTPKRQEALCEKISLKKAGIKGVFCGGT